MPTFSTPILCQALARVAAKMESCSDELNALDAQLGDGDLGVTMVRGARAIVSELPNLPGDVGMALLKCAQAFTKLSGSTYGTLLATGLMSAAKATKGRTEVPWSEVSSLLGARVAGDGAAQWGKIGREDCTRRIGGSARRHRGNRRSRRAGCRRRPGSCRMSRTLPRSTGPSRARSDFWGEECRQG